MKKAKPYLFTLLFMCICASLGLLAANSKNADHQQTMRQIHSGAAYDEYSLETLTNEAPIVIHGIVEKVQEPVIVKIPVSTELDVNDSNKGKFIETVETPTVIKIIEKVKGKDKDSTAKESTVTFFQEGGEKDGFIYEPHGGFLKEGEEVIIFLNDAGHTWGEQGVIKVKNGKTKLAMAKEAKNEYSLDEIKAKIKEKVK